MATVTTETLRVTIDAPFSQVVLDLADPSSHPEWATEFFAGKSTPIEGDEVMVEVPRMGGTARMKVDADTGSGRIDLYLAPEGVPYGPPLPVRVVPNGDGVDVLFTLVRMPGQGDDEWANGLESMQRELMNLKHRHETGTHTSRS